jgi:hypothetical protein
MSSIAMELARRAEGETRGSTNESSVRAARVLGALLFVMAVTAGFAELRVRSALVVHGDAAQTAARILAARGLFCAGFVGYLIAFLLDIPVALLFFVLLKPSAKAPAAVAAALRFFYAALAIANLRTYLDERLDAYDHGFKVALVLFGIHLLLLGVLLFRSGLVPKVFGGLIVLAGGAYLADSLSLFLNPSFHAVVAPYLAVPASFEILLAAWLLIRGVTRSSSPRPGLRSGRPA